MTKEVIAWMMVMVLQAPSQVFIIGNLNLGGQGTNTLPSLTILQDFTQVQKSIWRCKISLLFMHLLYFVVRHPTSHSTQFRIIFFCQNCACAKFLTSSMPGKAMRVKKGARDSCVPSDCGNYVDSQNEWNILPSNLMNEIMFLKWSWGEIFCI